MLSRSRIARLVASAVPLVGALLLSTPAAADPPHARRAEALAAPSPEDTHGLKLLHIFDRRGDSSSPSKPLSVGPDGYLYGIGSPGGANGNGSVFRVSLSGETQTIYNFGNTHRHGGNRGSNAVFGSDGALYGFSADLVNNEYVSSIYRITVDGTYKLLRMLPRAYRVASGRILRASNGYFYGTAEGYKNRVGWVDRGYGIIFRFDESGNVTTLHEMTKEEGIYLGEGLTEGWDGNLYGTTIAEGPYGKKGKGTVFKMTPEGQVTVLHAFAHNGHEGRSAFGALALAPNGILYGTTRLGGANDLGTIFSVDTQGNFKSLYDFKDGADGSLPDNGLTVAPDGYLYGVTRRGGPLDKGTLFRISTAGAFEALHEFGSGKQDGTEPAAAPTVAPNGLLYGTTFSGGSSPNYGPFDQGTVYRVTAAGKPEIIHSFNPQVPNGTWPIGGVLFASDGNMYGTTESGTVYRLSPKGEMKTILPAGSPAGTWIKGQLVEMSPGVLLGRATVGGEFNQGSVFSVTFDGTLRVLHAFSDSTMDNRGVGDDGLVKALDGNFYGVTTRGGTNLQSGTVYRVTPDGSFEVIFNFNKAELKIGGWPRGKLALGPDGALYGVTNYLGRFKDGAVYKITTDGVFTQLYSFNSEVDFGGPSTGLVLASNGLFYGVNGNCHYDYGDGIYSISPSGAYKPVHQFNGSIPLDPVGCESDAALMQASDGDLYGTTSVGGPFAGRQYGSIFRMSLDGEVRPVVQFNGMNGARPKATLVQGPDGALYGTARDYGRWTTQGAQGNGVVFKLDIGAGPRKAAGKPEPVALRLR